MQVRTWLLGVLLVAIVAVPAPAAAGEKWFGYNDNSTLQPVLTPAQDARALARAGANSARITVDWSWLEPKLGQLNLGMYDPIVAAWSRAGIRPLLIVTGAPRWAWTRWVPCWPDRGACHVPPDRTQDAAWSRFVAAVARRYPSAVAIEVWNEPNLGHFYAPGPDPSRYVELLRLARAAVGSVDPDMPVLGGSLAPVLGDARNSESYGMGPFLRDMYAAGARDLMDGLSIHVYPRNIGASAVSEALATTYEEREAAGDRSPVWVTEVGASTTDGYTPEKQADVLGFLVERLLGIPEVAGVYVHTLVDPPQPDPGNPEHGYGVLRDSTHPKPAMRAVLEAAWRARR